MYNYIHVIYLQGTFIFLCFLSLANFPSSVLEVSEDEVSEWLNPSCLGIGKTININGRKFLMLVIGPVL